MGLMTPRTRPKWGQELRRRGQGLVEYALILVTIAIVIIAILTYIGQVRLQRYVLEDYQRYGRSRRLIDMI